MIETIELENFKGITDALALNQLTLLRGNSGTGKSSWLEAVRVAILGYEPSLGKKPGSTLELASGDRMSVAISTKDLTLKRVFQLRKGATQNVYLNGTEIGVNEANEVVRNQLCGFTAMLNLDEFTDLSNDKKAAFLFELAKLKKTSQEVSRNVLTGFMSEYTAALPFLLEFKYGNRPVAELSGEEFLQLKDDMIEKIMGENELEAAAVSDLVNDLYELPIPGPPSGQTVLDRYLQYLNDEVKIMRRRKKEAQAATKKLIDSRAGARKELAGSPDQTSAELEAVRKEIAEIEKQKFAEEKLQAAYESQVEAIEDTEEHIQTLQKELAIVAEILKTDPTEAAMQVVNELRVSEEKKEFLDKQRTDVQVAVSDATSERDQVEAQMETIKEIREKIKSISMECPECKAEFPALKGTGKHLNTGPLQSKLKRLTAKIEQANQNLSQNKKKLEEEIENFNALKKRGDQMKKKMNAFEAAQKNKESLEADLKRYEGNLKKLKKGYSKQEGGVPIEDLDRRLEGLRQKQGELEDLQAAFEMLRSTDAHLAEAELDVKRADLALAAVVNAEKAVKLIRNEVTNSLTAPLEKAANQLLASVGDGLMLRYEVGGLNEFSIRCVNLRDKAVLFQTLSGGEKILYSTAQLAAFAAIADPPLKILQSELGELSGDIVPSFLRSVATMLKGTSIQAMFASCHNDFGDVPKEWEVVSF